MTTLYFPAIVEGSKRTYSVFFPDLPCLARAGKTLQQAALNAEEALRGHLGLMLRDGDKIPGPRACRQSSQLIAAAR